MAEAKNLEEARLLGVHRAIREFNQPGLVGIEDVGWILAALEATIDLDQKEKDLSATALKSFLHGFVAGIGATNVPDVEYVPIEEYHHDLPNEALYEAGGPSGGVAVQQGNDPDFVTQTGVRAKELKKDNKE